MRHVRGRGPAQAGNPGRRAGANDSELKKRSLATFGTTSPQQVAGNSRHGWTSRFAELR